MLDALYENRVECVIIGGVAPALHGCTRVAMDIKSEIGVDTFISTHDYANFAEAFAQSEIIQTNRGRWFRVQSLDALLRIARRRNRIDDQLALPEIEALIEIRDLGRSDS
jgi:hypothetical protein